MIPHFLLAFLVALGVSLLLTPAVRSVAGRLGALDLPGGRRLHSKAVPRLGGLAIFVGYFCGEGAAWFLAHLSPSLVPGPSLFPGDGNLRRIFIVTAMVVVLGAVDDLVDLSGLFKICVQTVIAVIAVLLGFQVDLLTTFSGGSIPLGFLGGPVAVLWILALMNSMNLVDGMDGLAGGVAFIAALALFCIAVLRGNVEIALLFAGLAGAVLGFLPYNLHPASIFMGDSGSLFLGTVFALGTIVASFKSAATIALAVPVVVLLVPLAETSLTAVRRLLTGRSIFQADRKHLHHQLLALGLSVPQATTLLHGVACVVGLVAIRFATPKSPELHLVLLGVLALAVTGLRWVADRSAKDSDAERSR